MTARYPNVLVIGRAKTGTTVVSRTVKNSISDSRYALEPKDPEFFSDESRVNSPFPWVVKIIYEHWDRHPRWRRALIRNEMPMKFGRIILIRRDPRDEMISRLFYSLFVYLKKRGNQPDVIRQWKEILVRKETDPESVSFMDLVREWKRLTGTNVLRGIKGIRQYARFMHGPGRAAFHLSYEDFIAGDTAQLEQYLGIPLTSNRDVGVLNRTSRSNASGNWKNLFLPEDVAFLSGKLDGVMKSLNYGGWELNSPAVLDPEHGSRYVDRLVHDALDRPEVRNGTAGVQAPVDVLLLRRGPTPTDWIYATSALERLSDEGLIRLRVVDTDGILSRPSRLAAALRAPVHVIVSRSIPEDWITVLERNAGTALSITYLIDDDFEAALASDGIPADYGQRLARTAEKEFPRLSGIATRLVAASDELARRLTGAETLVMKPNLYLPEAPPAHHETDGTVRIAYFGTGVHFRDVEMIAPAVREIHDRHPHVSITITGKEFPAALRGAARIRLLRQLSWPRFMSFLKERREHIYLAPLRDTRFNTAKSHIKFIEACIVGAAGVYSRRQPYSDIVEPGSSGLLADDDPASWFAAMDKLVNDTHLRKSIVYAAQAAATARFAPGRTVSEWRRLLAV